MMDIFQTINGLDILSVLDTAGIGYHKNSSHTYTIKKSDGTLDESFKISTTNNIAKDFGKSGIEGGPFDFIGRYLLKQDTQTAVGKANTVKWFIEKGLVESQDNKKEFVKSLKGEELLERFDEFKLGGYKSEISSFLLTRGFSSKFISLNSLNIGEIFKDIGYYDNYFCTEHPVYKNDDGTWSGEKGDNPKQVGVFIFPCYNSEKELIGVKLRRRDGKTIRGKKSIAVGHTGLLYDSIYTKQMIIVEGEMDYIVLKILGYKGVVANCGGVQSCRKILKSLLAETDKVICLYDNDIAGENGKKALADTMGRPVHTIEYPIREDRKGNKLSDVNDFFKVGYDTKTKWDKILSETKIVGEDEIKTNTRFILLDKHLEFYDTVYNKYQKADNVGALNGMTKKELFNCDSIPKYVDLCYRAGGKKGYYNTLDESIIITHGGEEDPILHPNIEKLINNIGGNKKKNIRWIHQSILYKLTHLNDVHIPALILYGSGGSGKGTFLNLLSKIFGEDNTQVGLGQKDLESSFDSYSGNKLIVEFKEVSSGNRANDKKILDRIKSFIGEPIISVNQKNKDVREVDNIARFHLSSNHAVPIQLDSKHSGNRRFTIIKTGNNLGKKLGGEINNITLNDKTIIKQYISWLYNEFPDIPYMPDSTFEALNNKEKEQLEESCEGAANLFFERFENKYPYIYKLTNNQVRYFLEQYCIEIGEDSFDIKYKQTNFDLGLSHRYEKKRIKIDGKSIRGYFINKNDDQLSNMPEGRKPYFLKGELPEGL